MAIKIGRCSKCGYNNESPTAICGLEDCGLKEKNSIPVADSINPSHYQGDYVMRIIEDFHLDFLDGQVIKYLLRSGNKPSTTPLEDHLKAKWYLDRKISNLKKS